MFYFQQDEKSVCRERGRSRIRRHCPILIQTKRDGTDSVSQTVDYSQNAERDVMTHGWSVSSIPQRMAITEDEKTVCRERGRSRTRRHCPTSIRTQERDGTDSVNQTAEHPQKAEGNVINRGRSVSIRPRRPITDDKKMISHQRGRSRTRHHCPTSIHTKVRDGTDSQTVEPALTPTDSQTVEHPQKAGGDHMRKKQDLTPFEQKCNRMFKSEREWLEDKRREIRKREILWRQRKLEVEGRYLAKMEGLLEDMAWRVQALDLFTEKDGETKSGQSKKNGQVPLWTGQYKAGDKKTRFESKAEKSRKGRIGHRERKRKGEGGGDGDDYGAGKE
eukprot:XP_014016593.1 PREDICTED: uncharacterized protein LOC106580281 isoform X2 [Salmo salar]